MKLLWDRLRRPWGNPPPVEYDWRERVFWLLLTILYYMAGWYSTQYYVNRVGRFYSLSTSLDRMIPLRVEFVWGYALIFAMLVAVILLISRRDVFMAAVKGVAYMSTIAFLFFPIFPVKMMDRPDAIVHRMEGLNAMFTSLFYVVDQPVNCFPSMHLALGFWAGYLLAYEYPKYKWIAYFCMGIVGVSVLMVRQHYLLDVIAGIALAHGFKAYLFGNLESVSNGTEIELA